MSSCIKNLASEKSDSLQRPTLPLRSFLGNKELLLEKLERLSREVNSHPSVHIEPDCHAFSEIKLFPLEIPDHERSPLIRHFFRPLDAAEIDQHPINTDDPETARSVKWRNEYFDHEHDDMYLHPPSPYRQVLVLSSELAMEFQMLPRVGIKDGTGTLKLLTKWRSESYPSFGHNIVSETTQTKPDCRIYLTWCVGSTKPHIKMMITHDVEGVHNTLLKFEVLAILAAMKERLAMESLKRHLVIPVMVFSLFRPLHGRVLTAYFDGTNMVIQMSELYPFGSSHQASFDVFMRYIAAGVNPTEDTRRI
ncbi:hypothetical protein BJX61DRAFT_542242 [Aspergillus egyptiacus]|nr:hypothetical protein BJX61DRAFT_542242 [Aspergillus egyptiacus]